MRLPGVGAFLFLNLLGCPCEFAFRGVEIPLCSLVVLASSEAIRHQFRRVRSELEPLSQMMAWLESRRSTMDLSKNSQEQNAESTINRLAQQLPAASAKLTLDPGVLAEVDATSATARLCRHQVSGGFPRSMIRTSGRSAGMVVQRFSASLLQGTSPFNQPSRPDFLHG
jgi:hypothetical protein